MPAAGTLLQVGKAGVTKVVRRAQGPTSFMPPGPRRRWPTWAGTYDLRDPEFRPPGATPWHRSPPPPKATSVEVAGVVWPD